MTESLPDALLRERDEFKSRLDEAKALTAGINGHAVIGIAYDMVLARADAAIKSGQADEMVVALQAIRETEW